MTIDISRPETAATWIDRRVDPDRSLLVPRVVAGVPLLAIGLAHVFVDETPMRPLVEAAGFPAPALVAVVGVAVEILVGLALLAGVWARTAALLAAATMVGAVHAHLVIDVWPNGVDNEPPLGLPIAVGLAAIFVLWWGPGRWSVDVWRAGRRGPS